jgi:hypothetical protein
MADNKLHITPELIRQYLEGKLDDRTMHAIERQALDDPFLAEALEGYAGHPADQQSALADLQSRLEKRVQPPRSGILRKIEFRWLAAASILLLLCVTAVMLMNRSERQEMNVVQADPLKKTDTAVTADTAIPRPMPLQDGESANVVTNHARPVQPSAEKPGEVAPVAADQAASSPANQETRQQAASSLAREKAAQQAPAREKAAQETAEKTGQQVLADGKTVDQAAYSLARRKAVQQAAPPPAPEKTTTSPLLGQKTTQPAGMAKLDSKAFGAKIDTIMIRGTSVPDSRRLFAKEGEKVEGYIAGEPSKYSNAQTDEGHRLISGVVIDEKTGNRLHGVIVSLSGTDRGAVTDTAGGFALQVDKKEKVNLAFSYIGYEKKNVTVAQNTSKVNVALPANEAVLNDVVVVGYGGKRRKAIIPPSPTMGEEVYQAYLQSKKIVSPEGNITPVSGEVHISFTVMPDSTLRNFRVLRSLSPEADKAAIRIVKEGPKWKPASTRRRATVELKVPIVIKQQP